MFVYERESVKAFVIMFLLLHDTGGVNGKNKQQLGTLQAV